MSRSFLIVLPKDSRSGATPLREAQRDFAAARDIETGALAGQHRDDLGGRVRLDRVIDAGERQIAAQEIIGLGDHVEIDDEARGLGRVFGRKRAIFWS